MPRGAAHEVNALPKMCWRHNALHTLRGCADPHAADCCDTSTSYLRSPILPSLASPGPTAGAPAASASHRRMQRALLTSS